MVESEPLRIAFSSDMHLAESGERTLSYDDTYNLLHAMAERADALVLAGDLTQSGSVEQMSMFAQITRGIPVPIYGLLGNHDRRGSQQRSKEILTENGGVIMIPGKVHTIRKNGTAIDLIGVEGGYDGSFAEELTYSQRMRVKGAGERLGRNLRIFERSLSDVQNPALAVFHYVPVKEMISGEFSRGHFMLGSELLGLEVDTSPVEIKEVFHGHAHLGQQRGNTTEGIPVTNVALPVYLRESRIRHGKYVTEELFEVCEY